MVAAGGGSVGMRTLLQSPQIAQVGHVHLINHGCPLPEQNARHSLSCGVVVVVVVVLGVVVVVLLTVMVVVIVVHSAGSLLASENRLECSGQNDITASSTTWPSQ